MMIIGGSTLPSPEMVLTMVMCLVLPKEETVLVYLLSEVLVGTTTYFPLP
jgi:hypothetical protein